MQEENTSEPDNESPLLLEMLQQVKVWQDPVTRGDRTFNDEEFFKSLAQCYMRQQALSPRQRHALTRLVLRYKAQIFDFPEYAEKLGLNTKKQK